MPAASPLSLSQSLSLSISIGHQLLSSSAMQLGQLEKTMQLISFIPTSGFCGLRAVRYVLSSAVYLSKGNMTQLVERKALNLTYLGSSLGWDRRFGRCLWISCVCWTPFWSFSGPFTWKRGPAAGKEASLKLGGPRPLFEGYGPLGRQKGVQQQAKKQVSS